MAAITGAAPARWPAAWMEVDEVAVKGRRRLVTLCVPLPVPAADGSNPGPDSAQEITPFHEQLGLWRLARDALRGHHDNGSRTATRPDARALAHARLTELLASRPATPALHALAVHRLAALAAQAAQEQDLPR